MNNTPQMNNTTMHNSQHYIAMPATLILIDYQNNSHITEYRSYSDNKISVFLQYIIQIIKPSSDIVHNLVLWFIGRKSSPMGNKVSNAYSNSTKSPQTFHTKFRQFSNFTLQYPILFKILLSYCR